MPALLIALAALAAALVLQASLQAESSSGTGASVFFNENFIQGLYTDTNVRDPDAVFGRVFASLRPEVTVYPTENYYYFAFAAGGKTIWGNLRLDASDRDRGLIHMGYFEYDENGKFQDREGGEKAFSAKDGVIVKKEADFSYSISYRGKRVLFKLNDVGMAPPRKAKLAPNETFVGPVFDESGMKFFIIYIGPEKHLMYVLNEDVYVPESFTDFDENVSIGRRTGFAFYKDTKNSRKILIGVYGENTARNNYYDGPFDQLPDNYASQTNMGAYIEEMYPYAAGRIDARGVFTNRTDERVAVTPYAVYTAEEELAAFVVSCGASGLSEAAFLACITHDYKEVAA